MPIPNKFTPVPVDVKLNAQWTEHHAAVLSDYLPVNLRDFWLGMAPIMQEYLFCQATDEYHFFSLIQMEHARFNNPRSYSPYANNQFKQTVPQQAHVIVQQPEYKKAFNHDKLTNSQS